MQTFLTTGNIFLMSSVNAQPRFFFFFSSDEAMRKAGVAHNKSSKDMESHVFMKAKTRVKILCLFSEVTGLSKFWDEPQLIISHAVGAAKWISGQGTETTAFNAYMGLCLIKFLRSELHRSFFT